MGGFVVRYLRLSLKMGGSLSDICDRGAGGAKQTTNLLIE
jgi:hypothetical protein